MLMEYSLGALLVALGLKFGRRWFDLARGVKETRDQRLLSEHLDWERHGDTTHLRKSNGLFSKYNR
jgi:hypothetical protein